MESPPEAAHRGPELATDAPEILQAATRVLTGVALRSLDVLHGALTLPQFRILAVLADVGPARAAQLAQALGIEVSAVTRFTDGMVMAGFVSRRSEPGHRGAAILALSAPGEELVGRVTGWRRRELTRIFYQLPQAERAILAHALRQLVEAGGKDYGVVSPS